MAEISVNNGVNVGALLAAREALKDAPGATKFTWRASCKWQNGTHTVSKVQSFHGLGEEQKHKTEFSFEADHPEIFASEDLGATPVEYVLVGLASCLTAGVAAVAIFAPLKWPKAATGLALITLALSFGVLGIGAYIAHAGGKIRHREFRNGPAPTVPVEADEH